MLVVVVAMGLCAMVVSAVVALLLVARASPSRKLAKQPKQPKQSKRSKRSKQPTQTDDDGGGGGGVDPPAGAQVATALSDFKNVDDSLVFPRGAGPEIVNITQTAPGTFRFELRHRGSWYDGDRDLKWNDQGKDKSRAEVSKFRKASDMRVGETWDIATTVRLDPSFVPSRGYCNIMQPVYDQSYLTLTGVSGDEVTAKLMVFTDGIGSSQKLAREFTIRRGQWTSIVVRVHFATDGSYKCSVDGDAFQGVSLDTTRGDQPFRSKWGLYGTNRAVKGATLGDQIVFHRNIYVRKVS